MGRSSSKREEIYAFLKDYIASHGYPPTTREIMAGVGLRSTASVHYHLSELSRSGAIEMDGGKNRAISLGAEAAPQGVPLIGVVTAGQPILAVENIEGEHPPIIEVENLETAVQEAAARAESGDVVIMSPASASFDRFKNFMERGKLFKALVEEL